MENTFGIMLQGPMTDSISFPLRCNVAQIGKPVENFIQGEELGVAISPKCGSCKCSKCPITGHTYSFKEEQELALIRSNLRYDSYKKCWIAKYPWLIDPAALPDNYTTALATLKITERVLKLNPL